MKKITFSILALLCLISYNAFSQGDLQVTGNGQVISNPDNSPSTSDGTDFGDIGLSSTDIHTFVLDNIASGGSAGNRLNNITVAIDNTTDFSLSATSLGNLTGNGGTIDLDITFDPASLGVKSATVTISHDNPTGTYEFDITGNSIELPADINITGNGNAISDGDTGTSTSNYTDFGDVGTGSSLTRVFTVENTGDLDLTNISAASLTTDTEFKITTQIVGTPLTLSGGASTTFEIEFTPSSVGGFSDVVTITSDDSGESPYTFTINGNGIVPPLVAEGATWFYLDNGSDQGTGWRTIGFNDSGWSSGPAELGYGDGDEATALTTPSNPKPVTTYFRHTFNISDATAYDGMDLQLEAIRDDGMVVYLNGNEVWRDNMAGTVDYTTLASGNISGAAESTWLTRIIGTSLLVDGDNTVAVEIHQDDPTSSDISFNFSMTPIASVPVSIVRGPYLQTLTSNSVIVKWRSNKATNSIVNYSDDFNSLSSNLTDNTLTTEHEVTLTGLKSNTKYFYDIADNDAVYVAKDLEMYAKTAPVAGTDTFVRAWILGDAGTSGNGTFGNDQENVRDAYYAYLNETGPTGTITNPNQTDMILFLGDNAYNSGTDAEYQAGFFDIYSDILKKAGSWSCLGNHDGYSVNFDSQSGPYYDIFSFPTAAEAGGTASGTEEYYSFDYANVHVIVLQSYNVDGGGSEAVFNTAQKAWLTTDINATSQDWIVCIFHHPPYTKGSHDSDNDGETGLKTMREQYTPILEAGGVDLVLSGHSHSYERSKFVKGHTGYSNTFSDVTHTIGANGNLSGRTDYDDLYDADSAFDGAYQKANTDTDGAIYITAGSSGKATGAQFNNQDPYIGASTLPVMYYSVQELGSTIFEIENDGSGGQNMNVKFLRETGTIDDYFTINKSGTTLNAGKVSKNDNIKLFPVPANNLLNIKVASGEILKAVRFYDVIGNMVKETNRARANVSTLKTGVYLVEIETDKNEYFKNIIVE